MADAEHGAMAGMGRMSMSSTTVSPLRTFRRTESGSAGVLVAAVALALTWATVAPAGYGSFWSWVLTIRLGPLAAEAAGAAGEQDAFWPMHDLLLANQTHLDLDEVVRYANTLGLDTARFRDDLVHRRFAARVAQDIESAEVSGVAGTPTFFVNGHRHDGPRDLATLNGVITTARARATAFTGPEFVPRALAAAGAQ